MTLAWNLNGDLAELNAEAGSLLRINLAEPSAGLQSLVCGLRPLCVVEPKSIGDGLKDRFVRGDDLIADYATSAETPYEVRLYWSPTESDDGLIIDFGLVVRTAAWVCTPEIEIVTSFEDAEVLIAASADEQAADKSIRWRPLRTNEDRRSCLGACVFRQDAGIALIEMIHPNDFRVISAKGRQVCYGLLGEPLEKGVIRRARMRTIVTPTAKELDRIESVRQRFLQMSLPLTP